MNDFNVLKDIEELKVLDISDDDLVSKASDDLKKIMLDPNNPALLPRSSNYFFSQIKDGNLIAYLDKNDEIVVCGNAIEISNGVYEYGSIYVRDDFRGMGMGVKILSELKNNLGHELGVLTVKPKESGNAGMIVDGIKSGFLPVPFSNLQDYDAKSYNECCCCDSFQNGNCEKTDNYCILLMENISEEVSNTSLDYIKTKQFINAVGNEKLLNKIYSEIKNSLDSGAKIKIDSVINIVKFEITNRI